MESVWPWVQFLGFAIGVVALVIAVWTSAQVFGSRPRLTVTVRGELSGLQCVVTNPPVTACLLRLFRVSRETAQDVRATYRILPVGGDLPLGPHAEPPFMLHALDSYPDYEEAQQPARVPADGTEVRFVISETLKFSPWPRLKDGEYVCRVAVRNGEQLFESDHRFTSRTGGSGMRKHRWLDPPSS